MGYMIKIRCCVCRKHLGEREGGKEPNMISDGYCDSCLAKLETKIKEFLKNKKELHDE